MSSPATVWPTEGLCALESVRTVAEHVLSVRTAHRLPSGRRWGGLARGQTRWLWQPVLEPMELLELGGPLPPELEAKSLPGREFWEWFGAAVERPCLRLHS